MPKKLVFFFFVFFCVVSMISWTYADDIIFVQPEPKVIVKGMPNSGVNGTAPGKVFYKPPNGTLYDSAIVIDPGVTEVYTSLTWFNESEKWGGYLYFNATPSAVGLYQLQIRFSFTNPSVRWRQLVVNSHNVFFVPNSMVRYETIAYTGFPLSVLVNRTQSVTDVMTYIIQFEITGSGYVEFYIDSHAVITDVNGDHRVDIKDLALIAKYYGSTYSGGRLDPLFVYDMNVDFVIDIFDLSFAAKDYGFIVP